MKHCVRTTLVLTIGMLLSASLAQAQASRTWVSGVGDDANPCSRTAPCKTFAGAISKTAAGGEISVLDPGGYGAVTITKSITINGVGTLASILASSTTGIIVNDSGSGAPGTIKVVIRSVSIQGGPDSAHGITGVRMFSGGSLVLDRVTIGGGFQTGVLSEKGRVYVFNSTISDNTTAGLRALTPAAGQVSSITVENSTISHNNLGVQAETGAAIRISNNNFYSNRVAMACGTGVTGTLSSAGNNRKGNSTGGPTPACAPNAAVTLE